MYCSVAPKWGILDNKGAFGKYSTLSLFFEGSLVCRRFVRLDSPNIQSFYNAFSEVNCDIPIYIYFVYFKWSIPSFTKFCVFMFFSKFSVQVDNHMNSVLRLFFLDFHQHLFVVCFLFVIQKSITNGISNTTSLRNASAPGEYPVT